jgi:tetratricopeptide (TPR) repeat protein
MKTIPSTPVVLLFLLTLGNVALAQPGTIPAGGGTSTATRPGSVQDSGTQGYWTEMSTQGRAGGALLGKVSVDSDPSIWEPILVNVICGGSIVYTTSTDAKGNFGILAIPEPGAPIATRDDNMRRMLMQYENCQAKAYLPGYTSNAITITHGNLRDNPNLGTFSLHRDAMAPGTALSSTRQTASANASKSFQKAYADLMDQKPDRAVKDLEKAVQIDPRFADAWYQLGRLQIASNPKDAEMSFSRAAETDPQFVLPYGQLAAFAGQAGKWKEAADYVDHSLKLDPSGTAQIWYYSALANAQLGKTDVAAESARKSLAMDPQHTIPNTEQLLAVMLVKKQDYAGALQHLRNCLKYLPSGPGLDLVKQQVAQLEQAVATK